MIKATSQKISEVLTRGVEEVIVREHLQEALASGKPLRIKHGVDPTSPDIHLGRAVQLLKLRDFQELGHKIVFIVGDFTGQIGDASDKESERPMLSGEQVKENMKSYSEQAALILDWKKVEFHYNSKWLEKIGAKEFLRLASRFGVSESIARENFAKRLQGGKRVGLHEIYYPILQGYDSVQTKADVEVGGTDQLFNMHAGRKLQEAAGQEPQDIMTISLLSGTDGRKMSSSWGNVINLTDEPNDMFGKIMSLADTAIVGYLILATRVPLAEAKAVKKALAAGSRNPRDLKFRLAEEIVGLLHGRKAAQKAGKEFENVFSKKALPGDIPEFKMSEGEYEVAEVLIKTGLADSRSAAYRLLRQGAVRRNEEKINFRNVKQKIKIGKNDVWRVGKRSFAKII